MKFRAISNEIEVLHLQNGLKDEKFDSLEALTRSSELTEQNHSDEKYIQKMHSKMLSETQLSAIQQLSKQQATSNIFLRRRISNSNFSHSNQSTA